MANSIIRVVAVASSSCRDHIGDCNTTKISSPSSTSASAQHNSHNRKQNKNLSSYGIIKKNQPSLHHTSECVSTSKVSKQFSFENSNTFLTANISTSTLIEKELNQLVVDVPFEHEPNITAALGRLQQKQSPLLENRKIKATKSFSLRTQEPFYIQHRKNSSDQQCNIENNRSIDCTAKEAINMNVGTINGGPKKRIPASNIDINWNNGYTQNGTIMTSLNSEKREHLYKILVIGELGTGKTSFIKRYVHQFFSQNYRATIGVDFALKVLHWDSNTIVRLQLWDIAGQERFGNMTRVYYKEAVGAFIVFDVTRSGTFDCVSKWKEDLDSKVQLPDGSPIPCILLANKCDQEKQGVVTSSEKMDEYVRENGFAGWFETSAKENINIDESARALVNKILLNDKLISEADLADSEKFNLNATTDQTGTETKSKCSC